MLNLRRYILVSAAIGTSLAIAVCAHYLVHQTSAADPEDPRTAAQRNESKGGSNGRAHREDEGQTREESLKVIRELTGLIKEAKEPDPLLHEERGDAYMVLGDFEKAIEDYSKAIATKRRGSTFFLLRKRVTAAIEKPDYQLALSDARDVTKLSISPPYAEGFAVLALILARCPDERIRNPNDSLDAAIRSSTMSPKSRDEALVQTALAAAYSVNGDFKSAVADQEKAIAAVKGDVPEEMKAQLGAYKAGKEYPFQKRGLK